MKFYHIPGNLAEAIDRLATEIANFKSGKTHPTKFRAFRVSFGIYEQRTENTFMVRIRCTAGGVTPRQLVKTAELAKKYGRSLIHLTTRQEMQLHDVDLKDTPDILRELLAAGLSTRGGGGNTVRNVMASHDSGINPSEVFDVTPHAASLSSRLITEPDSWHLPRKYKISFSCLESDNSLAVFNDLGYIARILGGKRGFKVYAAGGMGCRPRIARLLHDFIPENEVYRVCTALKQMFLKHGNRKNKNSNRLRFLWDELGEAKFLDLYHEEIDKIKEEAGLILEPAGFKNRAEVNGARPIKVSSSAFDTWKSRHVSDQKQTGLKSISVPINLGYLDADDAIRLGRLLGPFGENVLRLTMRQNIHLRNIPEEYLGNIFESIFEIDTLSHLPEFFGNMVACAGADTCTLGICLPGNVTPVIQKMLLGANPVLKLPPDFNFNISGCPNACGQHHIGDLGFYGRVARNKGKAYPAFYVLAGADLSASKACFAEKTGWVPSKDLPFAILEIMEAYHKKADQYPNFNDYLVNGGRAEISAICHKFSANAPTFEEDPNYFIDWGATSMFTTVKMGHGECSAGIYDMIEVEMKSIKDNKKLLNRSPTSTDVQPAIWNLVYSASNMLLVTRGIDPGSEDEVFDQYVTHFIDTEFIPDRFREIIQSAKSRNYEALESKKDDAIELGEMMIRLYHLMDNSLRFPGEDKRPEISAVLTCSSSQVHENKKIDVVAVKDFRGVACPMNFVKTKLELARIQSGQNLEIWLDDGEPIDNVPRSVTGEGHQILSKEKIENYWSLVIEKA